jgi:hypothetical protein
MNRVSGRMVRDAVSPVVLQAVTLSSRTVGVARGTSSAIGRRQSVMARPPWHGAEQQRHVAAAEDLSGERPGLRVGVLAAQARKET